MPTGYTAGVVDGKTETFQDYAKLCMRAFRAAIHMRDESLSKEWTPRVPSNYHAEQLQQAKEKLQQAKTLTDSELIEMKKRELNKSKEYYIKNTEKRKITRKKLDEFLIKAKAFIPPTPEHEDIAKFMIEQLETTIKYDGNINYYEKELAEVNLKLQNINVEKIRDNLIDNANKDIAYHLKEYEEDVERCNSSNKWVNDFMAALV